MITNQAYLFLIFVLNGLLIGFLFDVFRILRISFKTKDFVTYIEDIIFWILTGVIVLYSIFVFNNGEIRFFMFLGIGIGVVLHITLFSNYLINGSVKIIGFFKKVIGSIINILKKPFVILIRGLKKIFFKPISFITINIRRIGQKMKINVKDSNKNSRQKYTKIPKKILNKRRIWGFYVEYNNIWQNTNKKYKWRYTDE